MMWRVRVVYLHPIVELEDTSIYDFSDDLTAWRFHEIIFKSTNVISVSKPFKII